MAEELQDGHSSLDTAFDPEGIEYFARPPVRALIRPDPGYLLCDCDLSGADAQVVAWEADEPALKKAFKEGMDVHNYNGTRVWGTSYSPKLVRRKLTWRDECKRAVHGTHYLASSRELVRVLGWSMSEVNSFQRIWFTLNPKIAEWHERVDHLVQTTRGISNPFGYSITYFDRPANVLPKALAWVPQSTVAHCTERGAVRLHRNLPYCEVLLQVHDSVIFQIPFHRETPSVFSEIRRHLEMEIPYPNDPLVIPWGLATSRESWQKVKKVKWPESAST